MALPSHIRISLNDLLLPGPFALISDQPLPSPNCRQAGDVSKMFREVVLAEEDRDLHRFLHQDSGKLECHA